jgi:hypothetical protein
VSVGTIYLCCDDGNVYRCEAVRGDVWQIELSETGEDLLYIKARPDRVKGEPRAPIEEPEDVVDRVGLPVESIMPRSRRGKWHVYAIKFCADTAFPRGLLPLAHAPISNRSGLLGTFICLTESHRRLLGFA